MDPVKIGEAYGLTLRITHIYIRKTYDVKREPMRLSQNANIFNYRRQPMGPLGRMEARGMQTEKKQR